MVEEVWERPFTVHQHEFIAVYVRRPFREGLEVHCNVFGEVIRVAEFGYGELALLEMLRSEIEEHLRRKK